MTEQPDFRAVIRRSELRLADCIPGWSEVGRSASCCGIEAGPAS